jgi:hypothetical protein
MTNDDEPTPTETQRGIPAGAMLSKEENKMLDWLVQEHGSDRAKMIRWLIRKQYEVEQHTKRGRDHLKKALQGQSQAHNRRSTDN